MPPAHVSRLPCLKRHRRLVALLLAALSCLVCLGAEKQAAAELYSTAAVASDHPRASEIGADVMRRGGNAADAAIATGLALGVLNPFASGLGGGGFLVYYDASSRRAYALDFREMAPAAARRDMFVNDDGAVDHERFRHGGAAVAVPTELRGWWALHERFGRLPWRDIVEPIAELAAEFTVGELLPERLARFENDAAHWPDLHAAFFDAGGGYPEHGDRFARPELAAFLLRIAVDGPDAFYRGEAARAIVEATDASGGILTVADLESSEAKWVDPVTVEYREFRVIGMNLPSSGGIVIGMILRALEAFHIERVPMASPAWIHAVAQMMIHAFADRAHQMGDGRFIARRASDFLDDARIAAMVDDYAPTRTLPPAAYGPLIGTNDDDGTSHFSIIDGEGNAISVTSTINTSFGSYVYVPSIGVVLNNEMNDFSAQPGVPNAFGLVGSEANAIAPGKRPLSSMSPTIVLRDGGVVGALGGSGGPRIISATLLTLLQLIQESDTTAEAIEAPRFHHQWMPDELSVDSELIPLVGPSLIAYGYHVVEAQWSASVQAIWRRPAGLDAASDSAKHGAPAGY